MKKKLYSISELIDENIRLKKKIGKMERQNIMGFLNFLKTIKPYMISSPLDIDKIISGLEEQLEC